MSKLDSFGCKPMPPCPARGISVSSSLLRYGLGRNVGKSLGARTFQHHIGFHDKFVTRSLLCCYKVYVGFPGIIGVYKRVVICSSNFHGLVCTFTSASCLHNCYAGHTSLT